MMGSRSRRIAAQRGISILVVAILVVVSFVLSFSALLIMSNAKEKEKVLEELEKRRNELSSRQARLKTAQLHALPPTGIRPQAPRTPAGEEGGAVAAPAGSLPVDAAKSFRDAQRAGDEGWPAKYFGDKAVVRDVLKDGRLYATLQDLASLAGEKVVALASLADQAIMDYQLAEKRKGTLVENLVGSDKILAKRSRDYEDQLSKLEADLNAQLSEIEKGRKKEEGDLDTQQKTAKADLDATRLQHGHDVKNFPNEISKLQNRLEDLKILEAIRYETHRAHGRILKPDVPNRVAFIDIGTRERVRPGLKFLIAKRGKKGRLEYKGKVHVKKVWRTYSEVAITEIYRDMLPIVDGDLIVNPLFDPRRPLVICFLGEKTPRTLRPAWSINEASRRLVEIGSRVVVPVPFGDDSEGRQIKIPVGRAEVSQAVPLNVDFIIYTESRANTPRDEDGVYRLAVLLGIPIAEASDMYRFLED